MHMSLYLEINVLFININKWHLFNFQLYYLFRGTITFFMCTQVIFLLRLRFTTVQFFNLSTCVNLVTAVLKQKKKNLCFLFSPSFIILTNNGPAELSKDMSERRTRPSETVQQGRVTTVYTHGMLANRSAKIFVRLIV